MCSLCCSLRNLPESVKGFVFQPENLTIRPLVALQESSRLSKICLVRRVLITKKRGQSCQKRVDELGPLDWHGVCSQRNDRAGSYIDMGAGVGGGA